AFVAGLFVFYSGVIRRLSLPDGESLSLRPLRLCAQLGKKEFRAEAQRAQRRLQRNGTTQGNSLFRSDSKPGLDAVPWKALRHSIENRTAEGRIGTPSCPSLSSLHPHRSDTDHPRCPEVPLAAPVPFRFDAVRECHAAVFGPAHDRQAPAADAGRHAGGVEHLHGLLPGTTARRLLLCAPDHDLAWSPPSSRAAPGSLAPAAAHPE